MNPYEKAINEAESDLRNTVNRVCRELRLPEAYRRELITAIENNAEIVRFAEYYYGDKVGGF